MEIGAVVQFLYHCDEVVGGRRAGEEAATSVSEERQSCFAALVLQELFRMKQKPW
jgi:hypothetical protein